MICVQVTVLRCAGDGSAGSADDVPGQCAPQARHLNGALRVVGNQRVIDGGGDGAVEPIDETGDVGVDRPGCPRPVGSVEELFLRAPLESGEEQIAGGDLFENTDRVGGFLGYHPRDRGR